MNQLPEYLINDVEEILDRAGSAFRALSGAHILITGGTGFVGKWLLASAIHARQRLNLSFQITVVSRNPKRCIEQVPWIEQSFVKWVRGDVVDMCSDWITTPSHIIHAATSTDSKDNNKFPLEVFRTVVNGTERVLKAISAWRARRMLFVSSGAIYGQQPEYISRISEDCTNGPSTIDPAFAYHEGKRAAEMLCAISHQQQLCEISIARLFAFIGPYLPLDKHFAVGNFIGDSLAGRPIVVKGDGRTVRSYLYAGDLAAWLWVLLVQGISGRAYNVGSDQPVTISKLASLCSVAFPEPKKVIILGQGNENGAVNHYVPDIMRSKTELGLDAWTSLGTSIARTVAFHKALGK